MGFTASSIPAVLTKPALMVLRHGLLRFNDEQNGRTASVAEYTNAIVDAVASAIPQA